MLKRLINMVTEPGPTPRAKIAVWNDICNIVLKDSENNSLENITARVESLIGEAFACPVEVEMPVVAHQPEYTNVLPNVVAVKSIIPTITRDNIATKALEGVVTVKLTDINGFHPDKAIASIKSRLRRRPIRIQQTKAEEGEIVLKLKHSDHV